LWISNFLQKEKKKSIECLKKKFTKNAEKTYFFVFAKCILKRNLPRIFISKPVLRFRLNDEVQLTEVQKNLG